MVQIKQQPGAFVHCATKLANNSEKPDNIQIQIRPLQAKPTNIFTFEPKEKEDEKPKSVNVSSQFVFAFTLFTFALK